MKKHAILASALGIVLLLSGCSSTGGGLEEELTRLKNEVASVKEENEKLRRQLGQFDPALSDDGEANASGSARLEGNADIEIDATAELEIEAEWTFGGDDDTAASSEASATIGKDETVTIPDFAELTVVRHQFSKTIKPSKPDSFYTYYEAKEPGTTYLAFTIRIKSLLTSGRTADEFADVYVKYDEKYDYRTFSTIEEQGGADFTYTNITSIEPLKTRTLVFLAEVPEEIEKDDKPLKALVSADGKSYEYLIR